MLSEDEIAWLLLQLLPESAYYCGDSFAYFRCLDTKGQIRHANALLMAMPEDDRKAVAESFNRIYDAVAAHRVAALIATHPVPGMMQ